MRRRSYFICQGLLVAAFAISAGARPGAPDLQFGPGTAGGVLPGTTVALFPPSAPSTVTSLAVQGDRKIVAAGQFHTFSVGLARFLPDGTLDPEFGTGGIVGTGLYGYYTPSSPNLPRAVALQADGRIVVAGGGAMEGGVKSMAILRYLPNGSLDSSFGGTGKVLAGIVGTDSYASAITVLTNGTILAAGGSYTNFFATPANFTTLLCRFHPDGTPDESFGTAGQAVIPDGMADSMAVQPDGKIVMAATLHASDGTRRLSFARCDANGTLDPSFGHDGIATPDPSPGGTNPVFRAFALQSDGKMAVLALPTAQISHFLLLRLNADGSLDTDFAFTGAGSANITGAGVCVQRDGKLVVAGSMGYNFALVRYLPDGRLDTGFGQGGTVFNKVRSGVNTAQTLTLQGDGKIIIGGYAVAGPSDTVSMALARYLDRDVLEGVAVEWPAGTPLAYGQTVAVGSVPRGLPVTPETVITLRNTGSAPVTGLTGRFQGTDAGHFTIAAPPAPVLESGATTSLTIRFVPALEVSRLSATLVLKSDDPDMYEFVAFVQGSTESPVATLTLFENAAPVLQNATVDFGTAAADASVRRVFTIKNTGNIDLTLQGITFAGTGNPGDFTAEPPDSEVLAPGASTTFPVTFLPQGSGTRTARLRLASTDSFNPPLEVNLTGILATGIGTWRLQHFATVLNEGPAADLSDPDLDGMPNLLEYAILSNPNMPNIFGGTLVKNGNVLEYTLFRPATATDAGYILEWSDSLQTGWSTAGTGFAVLTANDQYQRVKFTAPAGSGKRFVRLRVTRL